MIRLLAIDTPLRTGLLLAMDFTTGGASCSGRLASRNSVAEHLTLSTSVWSLKERHDRET